MPVGHYGNMTEGDQEWMLDIHSVIHSDYRGAVVMKGSCIGR